MELVVHVLGLQVFLHVLVLAFVLGFLLVF
jgi:hypothetical protein